MDKTTREGILYALLAAVGYAFFPLFTKIIYRYSDLSAMDIAGWRFIIAAPLIWAGLALRARLMSNPDAQEHLPRLRLLGLGMMLAVGALAAFYGLGLIDSSLYVILFRTYPVLVLVISAFLGERLPMRGWIALMFALVGVVLMVIDPQTLTFSLTRTEILGALVASANALVIAFYNVGQGRVMKPFKAKARASAWTITGSLLALLPLLFIYGLRAPNDWHPWVGLVGLALVSTVIPVFAIYEGIGRIGASRFVIVGSVEPLLALTIGYLVLGEVLTIPQIIGGAIILSAVIVLEVGFPWRWGAHKHTKGYNPASGD